MEGEARGPEPAPGPPARRRSGRPAAVDARMESARELLAVSVGRMAGAAAAVAHRRGRGLGVLVALVGLALVAARADGQQGRQQGQQEQQQEQQQQEEQEPAPPPPPPRPDLRIVGLEVTPHPVPAGAVARVSMLVHNAGQRPAGGGILVRATHDAPTPRPLPGTRQLLHVEVDGLEEVVFDLPGVVARGSPFELVAAVDVADAVEEADETNNVAAVRLFGCEAPGAVETRDGIDNDCDGEIDEEGPTTDAAAALQALRRDQRVTLRALVPLVFALPEPALPLATRLPVRLRTGGGYWLVAAGGGGGDVLADRAEAGEWETFTLHDHDGGRLRNGDEISLRAADGVHWVVAPGGGGDGLVATEGESPVGRTFTLLRPEGGGLILSGDPVRLLTATGRWVVAEGGGGGEVNADRTEAGEWETFILEIVPGDGR